MRRRGTLIACAMLATCAAPALAGYDVYGPANPLTTDPYKVGPNGPNSFTYPKPAPVRTATVAANSKVAQGIGRAGKMVYDDFALVASAERANIKSASFLKSAASIIAGGTLSVGGKWGGALARSSKVLRPIGRGMNWIGYGLVAYSLYDLVAGADQEVRNGDVRYAPTTEPNTGESPTFTPVFVEPSSSYDPLSVGRAEIVFRTNMNSNPYLMMDVFAPHHSVSRDPILEASFGNGGFKTGGILDQSGESRVFNGETYFLTRYSISPSTDNEISAARAGNIRVRFKSGAFAYQPDSVVPTAPTAPPTPPDVVPDGAADEPMRPEAFDGIIRKALDDAGIVADDDTIAKYAKEAARDMTAAELGTSYSPADAKAIAQTPGATPIYQYVPQGAANLAPDPAKPEGSTGDGGGTGGGTSDPAKVDQEVDIDDEDGGFSLPSIHIDGFVAGNEQCPTWEIPFAKKTYVINPGCDIMDKYQTFLRGIAFVAAVMAGLYGFRGR